MEDITMILGELLKKLHEEKYSSSTQMQILKHLAKSSNKEATTKAAIKVVQESKTEKEALQKIQRL